MISTVAFVIAVGIVTYFITSRHNQVDLYGAIGGWIMNVFDAVLVVSAAVCLTVLMVLAVNVLVLDRDHVEMANHDFLLFMFLALVLAVLAGVLTKISTDEMIIRRENRTVRERRDQTVGWWLHMHGMSVVGIEIFAAWWCLQHPQECRLGGLSFPLMMVGMFVIAIGAAELILYKAYERLSRRFRKRKR